MKAAPNGPVFDPRRLSIEDLRDPIRAEEALTHWDELEPKLLTAIESHPQHGPRLAMLRRADRWLGVQASEDHPAGSCPSPEDLYDFGRGPGFNPLDSRHRGEIESHVRRCAECAGLVASLASPPPVPLHDLSGQTRTLEPVRRRPRALRRLVTLAAAAVLVLALGLWFKLAPTGSETLGFPRAPLLRGSSGGPLYYPRDRVLHVTDTVRAAFPALDGSLVFELEPKAEATSYRIDIARHAGDPFATEEANLLTLSDGSPTLRTRVDLPAGEYTWSARASVRGLDQPLGQRDFTIVDDEDVRGQLAGLASRSEPNRSLAAIGLLHERGYFAEARAIARSMPASPERDAYLAQLPGR